MNSAQAQRLYDSVVASVKKHRLGVRLPALRLPEGRDEGGAKQQKQQQRGGGIKKIPVTKKAKAKASAKNKNTNANASYTVGGLMVVFFASRLGKVATKTELVEFLRAMGCPSHDPQPRHLGMQVGLNFIVQGCFHPKAKRALKRGEYCLLDLRTAHPNHSTMHRAKATLAWDPMKRLYGFRCACCGSKEGEPHLKNTHLVTTLERGHCDPRKPLTDQNCVPMCKLCNMVYKDKAVFNKRGFVVKWLGGEEEEEEAEEEEAEEAAEKEEGEAAEKEEEGEAEEKEGEAEEEESEGEEEEESEAEETEAGEEGSVAAVAAEEAPKRRWSFFSRWWSISGAVGGVRSAVEFIRGVLGPPALPLFL
jgi:hypothetical protein